MRKTSGQEEGLKVPLADLRAQYARLKADIDAAVADVLASGGYIDGDRVHRLEDDIAALCGARYGIGVASGTDALVLALVACGIGAGDEVITTPFTFGATTEAIALVGATAVYADIDICTFNLDTSHDRSRDYAAYQSHTARGFVRANGGPSGACRHLPSAQAAFNCGRGAGHWIAAKRPAGWQFLPI